ncbi:hypothetical protein CDIK_0116 [Cucumispora dikerogammari]|nr:hypothetical protein CDIK_0116 [Cucumispora dikerogammari]
MEQKNVETDNLSDIDISTDKFRDIDILTDKFPVIDVEIDKLSDIGIETTQSPPENALKKNIEENKQPDNTSTYITAIEPRDEGAYQSLNKLENIERQPYKLSFSNWKTEIIDFFDALGYFFLKISLYRYFFVYDFKPTFIFLLVYSLINNVVLMVLLFIYFWQKSIPLALEHSWIPIKYSFFSLIYFLSLFGLGKLLTRTENHVLVSVLCQVLFYHPLCIFYSLVFYDIDGGFQGIFTIISGNYINRNILFSRGVHSIGRFFLFVSIAPLVIIGYLRCSFYMLLSYPSIRKVWRT